MVCHTVAAHENLILGKLGRNVLALFHPKHFCHCAGRDVDNKVVFVDPNAKLGGSLQKEAW